LHTHAAQPHCTTTRATVARIYDVRRCRGSERPLQETEAHATLCQVKSSVGQSDFHLFQRFQSKPALTRARGRKGWSCPTRPCPRPGAPVGRGWRCDLNVSGRVVGAVNTEGGAGGARDPNHPRRIVAGSVVLEGWFVCSTPPFSQGKLSAARDGGAHGRSMHRPT
jgi:hypothetical protein